MPKHTSKESALEAFEESSADYLARARRYALTLIRHRDSITVDDVRKKFPPPSSVDPRVMGAIFNTSDWVAVGFVNSNRRACHKRPVRQFARAAS